MSGRQSGVCAHADLDGAGDRGGGATLTRQGHHRATELGNSGYASGDEPRGTTRLGPPLGSALGTKHALEIGSPAGGRADGGGA